ncbi:hypothetical protein D3C81_2306010 [compost metagenome]
MIKAPIYLVTSTAVDRRAMMGNPLIALTCERGPEFMKAFEVVCMQDVPRRADDFLQNAQVAFV